MVKVQESPKMSFKGWKFSEWLRGNSKTIKELIKVGLPLVVSLMSLDPAYQQFIGTVVGKFILDCLEFYLKRIDL